MDKQHKKKLTAYMEFFWIQFHALPPGLMDRCFRHAKVAAATAAVSIAMLFAFRHIVFASGFILAAYLLWPIYTITKGYYEKTISGVEMVVVKVKRLLGERCTLYLRTSEKPYQYVTYYLTLQKKQREWFTEDMILTVYLGSDNPNEILAWDFVGMAQ